MMTLFYILDLRWESFGVDVDYDELPKVTRKYIKALVEQVGGVHSREWCYVINLIKGHNYVKPFETEEQ